MNQSNPALWFCIGAWCIPMLLVVGITWFVRGRVDLYKLMKREGKITTLDDED